MYGRSRGSNASPGSIRTYSFAVMKRIYPLALLLALAACQKDDPEAGLPAATHTGTNKSGCLINGAAFIPRGWASGGIYGPGPTYSIEGGFFSDSLYALALNGTMDGNRVTIDLFLEGRTTGTYLLNRNTSSYHGLSGLNQACYTVYDAAHYNGEVYITDVRHTGRVDLTYADVTHGISAGTFEFTAVSTSDPSKTVTITSGRFDRKQ